MVGNSKGCEHAARLLRLAATAMLLALVVAAVDGALAPLRTERVADASPRDVQATEAVYLHMMSHAPTDRDGSRNDEVQR